MFKKRRKIENDNEALKEFAKCVSYMLKAGIKKEDIDYAVEVGYKGYKKFFEKENIKTKPKMKVYEINAKDKEDAIKQLRALELDSKVEKDIIKILENN